MELKEGFRLVEIRFFASKKRKNEKVEFLVLNNDGIKRYSRKKDCQIISIKERN